jgi:tRNA U38,U39,U40 pseudouridine synthase TruA
VEFFKRLKRVCKLFTGRHDFSSFVDKGTPGKFIREVVTYRASGSLARAGGMTGGEGGGRCT